MNVKKRSTKDQVKKRKFITLFIFISFFSLVTTYWQSVDVSYSLPLSTAISAPPQSPPPPTCLVYMHIPKVGGRTMNDFLTNVSKLHGLEEHFPLYGPITYKGRHQKSPNYITTNKSFVFGHFSTKIFQDHPSLARDCFTITMLREPVDRVISAFFYHKHGLDEIETCFHDGEDISQRFSCWLHWQYSDDMTRQFAAPKGLSWMRHEWGRHADRFPNKRFNTTQRKKFSKRYGVRPVTESDLMEAKEHLKTYFDLVCFLDELDTCANRILQAFHMKMTMIDYNGKASSSIDSNNTTTMLDLSVMTTKKINKFATKTRPIELDETFINRVRNKNQLDLELYKYAKTLV